LLSGCSFVSLYSKNISGYAVPARHSSPEKYILRKANFGTGEARVGWPSCHPTNNSAMKSIKAHHQSSNIIYMI